MCGLRMRPELDEAWELGLAVAEGEGVEDGARVRVSNFSPWTLLREHRGRARVLQVHALEVVSGKR